MRYIFPKPVKGARVRTTVITWQSRTGARVCYESTLQKDRYNLSFCNGSPTETRTPDSALRGLRLNRLTMRPFIIFTYFITNPLCWQEILRDYYKNAK